MNEFWSVTLFWAFVIVAVVLALAFVLPWLMRLGNAEQTKAARRDINLAIYRDQMNELNTEFSQGRISEEQFLASKLEIETRAAEDALSQEDASAVPQSSRRLGYGLAALIPVATVAMYMWLGEPNALMVSANSHQTLFDAQPTEAEMLEAIGRMQERAKANPNDAELWETLANAYAMMSRWPEALEAFQKTLELSPNQASVLSGYAEALAMTGDMVLAGEPMEYVILALKADPNDRKGLELAAIHAFQNQAFAETVLFLDRLLLQVSPQMPYAQDIRTMRQEAQRLADGGQPQALAPQSGTSTERSATASQVSISGVVDVAPEIRAQIRPDSTLFLIARDGPSGPPLAAARVTMGDFPLPFRLDDRMVMNPGNTLSDHSEVVLLARITASGNPLAQTGDLEGRLLNVAVGDDNVRIVIDQVVP